MWYLYTLSRIVIKYGINLVLRDSQSTSNFTFLSLYNINLSVEYIETNEYEVGKIYKQSRDPGSIVTENSELKIYIASEVTNEEIID